MNDQLADAFRLALRQMVASVTVITSAYQGQLNGMTATAVASISMAPPSLLIVVNRSNRSHPLIHGAGTFAVNLLTREQQSVAQHFASRPETPFAGIAYRPGVTGSPLLEDAVASIECRLQKELEYGSHTLFVGDVVAVSSRGGMPLAYHDGRYVSVGHASA